jgi:uncharacterized membrane protein YfcA
MILIIGMLISGFTGTIIGSRFLTKAGLHYFKPVLNTILFLAAARLIWAGVEGLLALLSKPVFNRIVAASAHVRR